MILVVQDAHLVRRTAVELADAAVESNAVSRGRTACFALCSAIHAVELVAW